MKRYRLAAIRSAAALLLLFAVSGCSSPPIRTDNADSPERYLEFNAYVQSDLDEAFHVVFPSTADVGDAAQYRYCYTCAPFGDPNYYIWLHTEFSSREEYREEAERLQRLSPDVDTGDMGLAGYRFVLGTAEELALLLDDDIQDGRCFTVLAVKTDDDAQTVEYLYLDEFDSSPHRQFLYDLLTADSQQIPLQSSVISCSLRGEV